MSRGLLPHSSRPQLVARLLLEIEAVQMQYGQYNPIVNRVEKLVGMPRGSQRARLRLTVADNAGRDQVRVVG